MPATPVSEIGPRELRRTLERLDSLPMRPGSARSVLGSIDESDDTSGTSTLGSTSYQALAETDPAWALVRSRAGPRSIDPLGVVADHPWWPLATPTGPVAEAITRLWRLSTAVAFAARRLARESGLDDPEAIARAGFLHGLGLWALASVAPDRLIPWFATANPIARRDLERRWMGLEASSLGRRLALAWGAEPLVVDSAWLHADLGGDLNESSSDPVRLGLIQQAFAMARRTPWGPGAEELRENGPGDPRIRILTAEVQSRTSGSFVDPDSSIREERLTRENARLRKTLARLQTDHASNERFVRVVAESSATESPEVWADRAGLALCAEPGIAAARVVWLDHGIVTPRNPLLPESRILGDPDRPYARVDFRSDESSPSPFELPTSWPAWNAWARVVGERVGDRSLLDEVIAAHRARVDREEPNHRKAMLEALAEFAAGAGHELNNPLAVIVGRAQLLLARQDDPEAVRSLRAIIAQAQRAHRILRDLMYVARTPELRPRPCQPEEIVRACLRDLQAEAEARGIKFVSESRETGSRVWTDPDPLRQLADILVRNALEATPSGGSISITTRLDDRTLRWSIHDSGRGIGPSEGLHLFDPFYCGRQAGRGLGLGLPRAARIVQQAGGDLRWQSVPGHGTTFQVTLPVEDIPAAVDEEKPVGIIPLRALPGR